MKGCVGNIPNSRCYEGMCRKYSYTVSAMWGCVGNIPVPVSAMEGCVGNIPAQVSAMGIVHYHNY